MIYSNTESPEEQYDAGEDVQIEDDECIEHRAKETKKK